MSLQLDVESLRNRSLQELIAAHDYLTYSQRLWKNVLIGAREGERGVALSLSNPVTGSHASGAALEPVVTASLTSYLPSASVQQFVALAEVFLADLVRLWVNAYPVHLKGPVDAQLIVAASDKAALVQILVDRYVATVAFKTPREWFEHLNNMVKLGVPDDQQIDAFAELKATRDVFVHNRGTANATYVRKSGRLARAADGQPLDLPDAYVHDAWRLCHAIVADVGTAAAARA